jgi:hypothetical protein
MTRNFRAPTAPSLNRALHDPEGGQARPRKPKAWLPASAAAPREGQEHERSAGVSGDQAAAGPGAEQHRQWHGEEMEDQGMSGARHGLAGGM